MGKPTFPVYLQERLRALRVIAVVTLEDAAQAVPLAKALSEGGIGGMELTLRTDVAIEGIRRISREMPDFFLGAGTVLNRQQLRSVQEAGARFAVAPGFRPEVVQYARSIGMPFAPGVCTPSEIEQALALRCRLLKFFPSEPMGGLTTLRAMVAPYRHTGIEFVPLGGVGPANLAEYCAEPAVAAVGGSWIVPAADLRAGHWDAIRQRAADARAAVAALE